MIRKYNFQNNKNLFLSLILFLFLSACNEKQEGIKPSINNLTESIYASVTIIPESLYKVYATNSGILEKVLVEEGDSVKSGEALAKIVSTNPNFNIENAELGLSLSRENYLGKSNVLSSILNEMEQVEKQLQLDSLNYFRQQKLWNQNIGSKLELESKKLKYEFGQNALAGLKKKYWQAEIELKNNLQRSQNNLRKAQSDRSDYFIKSKIDGKVYTLLKNEGELIIPQEPLATIGKANDFIIEMQIDEVDIAKITQDQRILISLDAYQGAVFDGSITKIYPQKDPRTQTFKIEGKFVQSPPSLYAGLSGEANIIFAQRKNVISIPLDYLIDNQTVNTPNGEVKVKTGIKTMSRIEILSGIDTSTIILKP